MAKQFVPVTDIKDLSVGDLVRAHPHHTDIGRVTAVGETTFLYRYPYSPEIRATSPLVWEVEREVVEVLPEGLERDGRSFKYTDYAEDVATLYAARNGRLVVIPHGPEGTSIHLTREVVDFVFADADAQNADS